MSYPARVEGLVNMDWQWSQLDNQVYRQGHENVWVSFQAGSAWRYSFSISHTKIIFLYHRTRGKITTKLSNKFEHPLKPNILWFFSDKKKFCQDQMGHWQNNYWLASSLLDVVVKMKTKYSVYILVFEVITSDGDIMPPFIFLH